MEYLPPLKNATYFNNVDFNYQDKTLTVKELDTTLTEYDDVDTALTASVASIKSKLVGDDMSTTTTVVLVPTNSTLNTNCTGSAGSTFIGSGFTKLITSNNFINAIGYSLFNGSGTHSPGVSVIMGNYVAYSSSTGMTGANNVIFSASTSVSTSTGCRLTSGTKNFLGGSGEGCASNLTTGYSNIAIGPNALNSAVTTFHNVALGNGASRYVTGEYCVSVGILALEGDTGGSTGIHNVGIGYSAMPLLTSGGTNTAVGNLTAPVLTTGTNNSFFGYEAGAGITTASNGVYLGNASVTEIWSNGTLTTLSDARDKIDIKDITECFDATAYINGLSPKCYIVNPRERYFDKITTEPEQIEGEELVPGDTITVAVTNDGSRADTEHSVGLLAQDVQQLEATLGITDPLVVRERNADTLTIAYSRLIPVLCQALKESNIIIADLMQRVAVLESA